MLQRGARIDVPCDTLTSILKLMKRRLRATLTHSGSPLHESCALVGVRQRGIGVMLEQQDIPQQLGCEVKKRVSDDAEFDECRLCREKRTKCLPSFRDRQYGQVDNGVTHGPHGVELFRSLREPQRQTGSPCRQSRIQVGIALRDTSRHQPITDVLDRDTREPQHLATRSNGRQDILRIVREQDKDGLRVRFFQMLQQRGSRIFAQQMRILNQYNFPATHHRAERKPAAHVTNLLDADTACHSASLLVHAAFHVEKIRVRGKLMRLEERLRKRTGDDAFPDMRRPDEKVAMRQSAALKSTRQQTDRGTMADDWVLCNDALCGVDLHR